MLVSYVDSCFSISWQSFYVVPFSSAICFSWVTYSSVAISKSVTIEHLCSEKLKPLTIQNIVAMTCIEMRNIYLTKAWIQQLCELYHKEHLWNIQSSHYFLNKIKLKTNMQHRIKESLKDNFLLSLLLFSILWILLAIMVIHKQSNSIFFILIKYGRIGWNCRSFSVMVNYSTNINKNNNYLLIQLNRIFLVFKHVLFRQLLIRI